VNVLAYDYEGYGLSFPVYNDSSSTEAHVGARARSFGASSAIATAPKSSVLGPDSPSLMSMMPDFSHILCGILPPSGAGVHADTDVGSIEPVLDAPVPNEAACYRDIDAAYSFLVQDLGCHPSTILVMGRSLGSGPSCYLAERLSLQGVRLGGLVLQSALASVFRVALDLQTATLPGDSFPNIDRIANVDCPILVVHGTKDTIVPFSHGEQLFNLAPSKWRSCSWIPDGGHNDIDNIQGNGDTSYLAPIRSFLCDWVARQHRRQVIPTPAANPSA
jgi:pimeloyl-ACP methyl ester carboxylesterase